MKMWVVFDSGFGTMVKNLFCNYSNKELSGQKFSRCSVWLFGSSGAKLGILSLWSSDIDRPLVHMKSASLKKNGRMTSGSR